MESSTKILRRLLDERGVEWMPSAWSAKDETFYKVGDVGYLATELSSGKMKVCIEGYPTPEQAIAATLGRESWVNPTWERWHKSLKHDEIKSIGDAVEQLMYEAIEFGGDMGPNGNTYNGIDEGDVLTAGFINEWVERIAEVSGAGTCQYVGEDSDNMAGVVFHCSKCGNVEWPRPRNYCPSCGRMILR